MEYVEIFGYCCIAVSVSVSAFGLAAFAVIGMPPHRFGR